MGNTTVYFARNIADAMFQLKTTANLRVCGGCTQVLTLPETALIVRNIDELRIIDRRERYIEIGSAVTLSQLLDLGERRLPSVLYEALSCTAFPFIRNIATVGGNVCASGIKRTLFAPLLAVESRLEFRSHMESRVVPIGLFSEVPSGFMLTKIRIPLDEWDVAVFRRVGPAYTIDNTSASFVFLANTQKGVLSELRLAFCGLVKFRSRDVENVLIGAKLPLSTRDIQNMTDEAAKAFDDVAMSQINPSLERDSVSLSVLKIRFLNLLKYSLEQLT